MTTNPANAQLQVLWKTEYVPALSSVALGMDVSAYGVAVVGYVNDSFADPLLDGFLLILDPIGGQVISYSRHHLGYETSLNEVAWLSDGTLLVGGERVTFDGLCQSGVVARMTIDGDALWTLYTDTLHSRAVKTLTLSSDTSFVINTPWQEQVLGQQVNTMEFSTSGVLQDTGSTPYSYGQYIDILKAVALPGGGQLLVGTIFRIREPLLQRSIYMLWTDENLDTIRSRVLSLPDSELNGAAVDISPTGSIYIATIPPVELPDTCFINLFKLTSEGEIVWRKHYFSGFPWCPAGAPVCKGDSVILASHYFRDEGNASYVMILDSNGIMLRDSLYITEGWDVILVRTKLSPDEHNIYLLANEDSIGSYSKRISVTCIALDSTLLANGPPVAVPGGFNIVAFPNPFNSTLRISLDAPLHADVSVLLYDLLGREVDVIYRGRIGSNAISYVAPAALASGVYFVRASAGERVALGKVVLLK
ncbi:MAG: T9SS type A sorting domain-containing protein [Calditrichaeota bacterium]|nr:T9SS type A sorting domain-containing protein [Calditrichota bacterium]MCB9369633.1 T9SS type A sorting domain-containing protein [Calditrichota bacterium]